MISKNLINKKGLQPMTATCFAIFESTPITENVRKSISNQTFYTMKGLNIARKKNGKNSSKTQAQMVQRTRWTKVLDLEALFEPASQIGFPRRKTTETYHNAFMSANTNAEAVSVSEDLEVTVNYPEILCAQGRLKLPRSLSVSADAETRTLTFTHAAEGNGCRRYANDQLYALVVETTLEDSELYELGTRSESEPVAATLPEDWDMDSLAIYVFATTADGKKASNSKYLETA